MSNSVTIDLNVDVINAIPRGQYVASYMDNLAAKVLAAAQRLVPVDTGRLQRSIVIQRVVGTADRLVIAKAPYAGYVELGTSKMAAQPFMRPALDEVVGL